MLTCELDQRPRTAEIDALASLYPWRNGNLRQKGAGIPFASLLKQFPDGVQEEDVIGGSGAPLVVTLNRDFIDVEVNTSYVPGVTYYDYCLWAFVDVQGVLAFTLKTRGLSHGTLSSPHPDLFAAQFRKFSLGYFQFQDIPVTSIQTRWSPSSINWHQYYEALNNGATPAQAVAHTWTAQDLARLGWYPICDEPVQKTGIGPYLELYFSHSQR